MIGFLWPMFLASSMANDRSGLIEQNQRRNDELNEKNKANGRRVAALQQQADSEQWNGQVFRRVEEVQ